MGVLTNTLGGPDVDCIGHNFQNISLETAPTSTGPQEIINLPFLMGYSMVQTEWQFQNDQRATIRRETNWTWYYLGKTNREEPEYAYLLPCKCPRKQSFSVAYIW